MASPLESRDDRRWIREYSTLQLAADKRVAAALRAASQDAERKLKALDGKPGVGAAMRRAQILGNQGVITKLLKDLFKDVGKVVRDGQGDAAALAERLAIKDESSVWEIIETDARKRVYLQASLEDTARRNVQSMMTRILKTERPLSARVYHSESIAKGHVSRAVNSALARGDSAADLAKEVRTLIDPSVPGGVSYAATRLARTEINNAFHAQSIQDATSRPWVTQVQWNLSKSHPDRQPLCACDRYANTRHFPADNIPEKPHPNCLCSITPVVPDFDTAFNMFLSGQYEFWIQEQLQPT